jgi:hypothetical protein
MIHGIGTGTDLRFGWMQILVAACIVSVLAALAWRIRAHPYPGGHRTAVPPSGVPATGHAAVGRPATATSVAARPEVRRVSRAEPRETRS